jgi:MraZ protein
VFRGVSALNLDGKGRMTMPTKYRQRLIDDCDGHMIVTIDREKCLLLYPLPEWEIIEKELVRLSSFDKRLRKLQRILVGHATDADMDGNGRILLPPPLREFAGMQKKIMLVGQGKKFELWDEEAWNTKRDEWMNEEEDDGADIPEELRSFSL